MSWARGTHLGTLETADGSTGAKVEMLVRRFVPKTKSEIKTRRKIRS